MKALKLLLLLIFFKSGLHAQNRIEVDFSSAYQTDNFKWSIAGNSQGQNPNILSEVSWRNLKGPAFNLDIHLPISSKFALKANLGQFFILNGRVNDTDYLEDNRTSPSFSADLESNKGYSRNFLLGLSYQLHLHKLRLQPMLAYGLTQQLLYLQDDNNLNSTYKTNWYGIMAGLNLKYSLFKSLELNHTLHYHQLKYRAVANWNLIENFAHPDSFKHYANGYAVSGDTKAVFLFHPKINPFAYFRLQLWNTGKGIDEVFYANGTQSYTQLQDVARKSAALGIGIQYKL
ncbi:hypothetical protein FYC62_04215 [Pedobacter aquae]|uniref:Protochlamydia outer membrane protein domain-containing protein n=1 Tax=Pedobacter aquae TaxID=2605747 RepID=A0A5C0VE62_9SPHI|nr:hypothetical protein [Pedobacter aquae]QEK50968.1 hypothetical protein FYC62_04215 [Pedobacter aquae]